MPLNIGLFRPNRHRLLSLLSFAGLAAVFLLLARFHSRQQAKLSLKMARADCRPNWGKAAMGNLDVGLAFPCPSPKSISNPPPLFLSHFSIPSPPQFLLPNCSSLRRSLPASPILIPFCCRGSSLRLGDHPTWRTDHCQPGKLSIAFCLHPSPLIQFIPYSQPAFLNCKFILNSSSIRKGLFYMPMPSIVWDYFDEFEGGGKCRLCGCIRNRKDKSTSTFWQHLERVHGLDKRQMLINSSTNNIPSGKMKSPTDNTTNGDNSHCHKRDISDVVEKLKMEAEPAEKMPKLRFHRPSRIH